MKLYIANFADGNDESSAIDSAALPQVFFPSSFASLPCIRFLPLLPLRLLLLLSVHISRAEVSDEYFFSSQILFSLFTQYFFSELSVNETETVSFVVASTPYQVSLRKCRGVRSACVSQMESRNSCIQRSTPN